MEKSKSCPNNRTAYLRNRFGDLWWYTILMFAAQRFSDVVNFFVGLWIVPGYVPQQELGAVLPLTQFASFIGIPLAIVAIPFMKYLSVYSERGEDGKVKALLRDVLLGTSVTSVLTLAIAWFAMPFFFERMRLEVGSLGILIVAMSVLMYMMNIFQNALQGLKLFSTTVFLSLVCAPVRMAVMLATIPFRPISGYFTGQTAAPGVFGLVSLWALRKKLGKSVKAENYWREDGKEILRYTLPVAVMIIFFTIFMSIDQLVIRHRLSDFESAGYYIISRFADVAIYFGSAFMVFLFPLVSARKANDSESRKALMHSVWGSLASGLAVSFALLIGGRWLLSLNSQWGEYSSLSFEMFLLALNNTFVYVCACFTTYETAQGRFRFLWYGIPLAGVKALLMYAVMGYTFFEGFVPQGWLDAIGEFNPRRLVCLLNYFILFNVLYMAMLVWDVVVKGVKSKEITNEQDCEKHT